MICMDCGLKLTDKEHSRNYFRCEFCEDILYSRLKDWRNGKNDTHLDIMFHQKQLSIGSLSVH